MKKILATIALFFKRLSFLYRLIGIVIAGYIVFGMAIPDIRFNMSTGTVIEMTLDQLMKTPADEIPRYLKIKDAVVPSGSYVEFRKSKSNSLRGIYYPVYPSNEVKIDIKDISKVVSSDSMKVVADSSGNVSLMKDTDNINSKLVIYDSHVKDSDLDSTGTYFSNPNFTIEGKYDGEKLGEDVLNLFKESGLNVSPEAVVLNRGDTGMETSKAIMLVILGLLAMFIGVLSFIPEETLRTW
jgi:hypothetical protein